jgi:hypothetical protein
MNNPMHLSNLLTDRLVKAAEFPVLWDRKQALFELQQRKPGFIRIWEEGKTVDYSLHLGNETVRQLYCGTIPDPELHQAVLIVLHNDGRARRSSRPGIGSSRIKDDPRASNIYPPTVVEKNPTECVMEYSGPSGHLMWAALQPWPIWPQQPGQPASHQPFHTVYFHAGGPVPQVEMNRAENILDLLTAVTELNRSLRPLGQLLFRGAINGWYYSDAPNAQKAGAGEAQAHSQIVRFRFPIEKALFRMKQCIGPVSVSDLADGWGTALALGADDENIEPLAYVTERALQLITGRGRSFNLLAVPGLRSGMIVFIADRTLGTPEPYFTNEWAFSEFGRVIVVDSPLKFYQVTKRQEQEFEKLDPGQHVEWTKQQRAAGNLCSVHPDLHENAIAALKMITAPQKEIDEIIQEMRGFRVG